MEKYSAEMHIQGASHELAWPQVRSQEGGIER